MLHYGYDMNLLREGFQKLIDDLHLDFLFIDTHPGLNEETHLSIALSDVLMIVMRPDQQDYQGTAVTVEVSHQLEVPSMYLVMNKIPSVLDRSALRQKLEETYGCPIVGLIPHAEEMAVLGSGAVFP